MMCDQFKCDLVVEVLVACFLILLSDASDEEEVLKTHLIAFFQLFQAIVGDSFNQLGVGN